MSIICGLPAAVTDVETILRFIDDILVSAGEYGGKAFGRFPRNVIVQRMKDRSCYVCFDNVDVWFTSEDGFREFLETMEGKAVNPKAQYSFTRVLPENNGTIVMERYGSNWKQYKLSWPGRNIVRINTIVSKEFPVDDFDVNCLTYTCKRDYSTGEKIITKELKAEGGHQKEDLISAINNKEARMLDSYGKKIMNHCAIIRINRFIMKGWTVKCGEILIKQPISANHVSDFLSKLELTSGHIRRASSTVVPVTVEKHEAKALVASTPALDDTLETLVRNNPLVKEAIARIIAKMICESANVIESQPQVK